MTHCWGDKEVHIFPNNINMKINITVWLEFELTTMLHSSMLTITPWGPFPSFWSSSSCLFSSFDMSNLQEKIFHMQITVIMNCFQMFVNVDWHETFYKGRLKSSYYDIISTVIDFFSQWNPSTATIIEKVYRW